MSDSRLEKIRGLLATAESFTRGGNLAAAQSYQAKAQELMTKWSIEEAMLADTRGASTNPIDKTDLWEPFSPYQTPKVNLLDTIARHNNCKIIFWPGSQRVNPTNPYKFEKGVRIHLIGRETDRRMVETLYTSLLLQVEIEFGSESVQETMRSETSHPGHRIRWRNSFVDAYALGVNKRLREAKQVVVDATPGSALVLRSSAEQLNEYMGEHHAKVKSTDLSHNSGFAGARVEGYNAGQRSDINQARVGQNKKEIGK